MIPIDLIGDRNKRLASKLTKYVNSNLKVMVEVFMDEHLVGG